jgi:hypothetical protein
VTGDLRALGLAYEAAAARLSFTGVDEGQGRKGEWKGEEKGLQVPHVHAPGEGGDAIKAQVVPIRIGDK